MTEDCGCKKNSMDISKLDNRSVILETAREGVIYEGSKPMPLGYARFFLMWKAKELVDSGDWKVREDEKDRLTDEQKEVLKYKEEQQNKTPSVLVQNFYEGANPEPKNTQIAPRRVRNEC